MVAVRVEGHACVDVLEGGVIEKIVGLPAELQFGFLSQLHTLKKCEIGIEDTRKANKVSLQVADFTQRCWAGEAGSIDPHRCARCIGASSPLVRITNKDGSCLHLAASIVGAASAVSDVRDSQIRFRFAADERRRAGELPVVEQCLDNMLIQKCRR